MDISSLLHEHDDRKTIDRDPLFEIDPITRNITNGTNKKTTIMQYDHNSERYTFVVDRYIDDHDLMDCNRLLIHYNNIDSRKMSHPDVYEVTDIFEDPDDNTKMRFTWLVSDNATQYNGMLSFAISFECIEEKENNEVDISYRWSTNICKLISVAENMRNVEAVVEKYSDVLLEWEHSLVPYLVKKCYIEREFATSAEVAHIFGMAAGPDDYELLTVPYEKVTDSEIDAMFDDIPPIHNHPTLEPEENI